MSAKAFEKEITENNIYHGSNKIKGLPSVLLCIKLHLVSDSFSILSTLVESKDSLARTFPLSYTLGDPSKRLGFFVKHLLE